MQTPTDPKDTTDRVARLRRVPPRVDNSELIQELDHWSDRAADVARQLQATLTEPQLELFRAYDDARTEQAARGEMLMLAEARRHLPGLAGALLVLEEHLVGQQGDDRGLCCEGES